MRLVPHGRRLLARRNADDDRRDRRDVIRNAEFRLHRVEIQRWRGRAYAFVGDVIGAALR